jgi:ribonuclease P protein component
LERLTRLARPADFARVRAEGRARSGRLAVLITLANGLEQSRFGFTAGKRVGGAVQRNRAKRLLREAVRAHLKRIQHGWDMVWIARAGLPAAALAETNTEVATLLRRANVLVSDGNAV